jgi:predicted ATPase/DNA-binding SARP family transcriptional activator/DNA-binding CsgD family transcriptional regulator
MRMSSPAGFEGVRRAEVVRIWLLGGFRVSVGSRTITQGAWRLRKAAALVKLLALAPGHRLHREQAMEILWPDSGRKKASNNLRKTLHAARGTLDPAEGSRYLASKDDLLALCPDVDLWIDVEAFEEGAATARRAKELVAYRAAIDLYAGELLPGERYEEWAEEPRRRMRETYLSLLLGHARVHEEHGDYERGIEALRRMVAEESSNEEAHVGLMRLYALLGSNRKALAQYGRLERALLRELGTEPTASSRSLREEIAAGRFPPREGPSLSPLPEEALGTAKHNLPAARTSFVGREHEMLEVKRALAMTRLLTLTGVGGSGKTRLALEVARELVGTYPDGVWLVELAPLAEGELVPQAVTQALGVREQPGRSLTDTLTEVLQQRDMLLVLDNCEHLADSVATLVDTLLDSCPRLRVLATSRETLGVEGEALWRVSSLSVPDTDRLPTAGEMTRYDAVRLFLDRSRLRRPDFDLTPNNTEAVAEICQRLEGMPLAIELATARVGTLSVGQISERLRDPLGLLSAGGRTAGSRQQTLRGTLDWSYELLSESERTLFARLSVFAGGWSLEAAEAVGVGDGVEKDDVLDLLSKLVDKSLVVTALGAEGTPRYRMLEPVRQYAIEKLEEGREAEANKRRHAAFFLALAERAYPELRGPGQVEWLHRLILENDNLRTAMAWLLSAGDGQSAARLGSALWPFWYFRGQHREGRAVLKAALESKSTLPLTLRIRTTVAWGAMAYGQADLEAVEDYAEKIMELSRQAGDDAYAEGWGRTGLGLLAMNRQDYEGASAQLERAVTLLLESGEAHAAAQMRTVLGTVALLQGDFAQAESRFEDGLAMARRVGDRAGIYNALFSLSQLALIRGDYEEARSGFDEGMALSRQMEDRANVAYCLEGIAAVAGMQGQTERSVRLFGAAERLLESVGVPVWNYYMIDRSLYEHTIAELRDLLGEADFGEAWADGRAMTLDDAIEYALAVRKRAVTATSEREQAQVGSKPIALTHREEEIANLVARGLTNRQIASELVISEHTAATHIRRILKKLGLQSRSQVGSWLAQQLP